MSEDIELLKVQIKAELQRLEAHSSAKDVAGKAIGKDGLKYITAIVVIGVMSSLALDSDKIAAVMGLLGASLTALISMLASIAGTVEKEEKPEFDATQTDIQYFTADVAFKYTVYNILGPDGKPL